MFFKKTKEQRLLISIAAGKTDFIDMDLSNSNLSGKNLSNIHMSGSDLTNANMRVTSLTRTVLCDSILNNADFDGAFLQYANLSQTKCFGTNFSNAELSRAVVSNVFGQIVCPNAKLVGCDIRNSFLSGSDMRSADLSMADCSNTKFENANLSYAIFNKTILLGTNLQGADLTKMKCVDSQFNNQTNLKKTKLHGSDFSHAQLSGVQLQGADIQNSIFIYADMTGSDLSFIKIAGTNMSYAKLPGAKFRESIVNTCDFRGANLKGVDMSYADLSYTDFSGANLENANLSYATLNHTILEGAILQNVNLDKAKIKNTNLRKADLQNATLKLTNIASTDFTEANLSDVFFENATIEDSCFLGSKLFNVNLSEIKLLKCNFSNVDLSNGKLKKIIMAECNLSGIHLREALLNKMNLQCTYSDFSGATMSGCSFNGIDMSNCNFDRAILENITLSSCVLIHSNFTNANLVSAKLVGSNFSNGIFRQCHAEDADFSGANLEQIDFSDAILRGAKLFNTKGRIKSKTDARINYKTFINSNWPANVLADWHVSGARIEDFEAFPEDVQDACLGDRAGLTLFFSKSIGAFQRHVIDGIIFGVLGTNTKCKVTDFRERGNTAYVRIYSDNPTDLEIVAEVLYRKIWERQHTSAADALIRIKDFVLTEKYKHGLNDLRKHLDRMELRLADSSEHRSSLLWAWNTLTAGQTRVFELDGIVPLRTAVLYFPADESEYGSRILRAFSRLDNDGLISFYAENLYVAYEDPSVVIGDLLKNLEVVAVIVSKSLLSSLKGEKLLDDCFALWRRGLLKILPINVDCENWHESAISMIEPVNTQMLTSMLKSEIDEIIASHLRLVLRLILGQRQEIGLIARTLPKTANRINSKGMLDMAYKKILFLASNPMATNRISIDEEARDIEQKLLAVTHRDAFQFVTRWAVRPDDLQDALLREQPIIVHFSGHGQGMPGLVFHSDTAREPALVSAESLQHLFSVLRDNIRIVVLNACYSEEQAKAIVETIDFVVGMKDSIGDKAARIFAAAFYRGLGFGRSVQTAFDLGVSAVKLQGIKEDADLPVLLTRGSVKASAVYLAQGDDSAPR